MILSFVLVVFWFPSSVSSLYFLLWWGEWKWFPGGGSCLYSKYTPCLSLGDLCTGNEGSVHSLGRLWQKTAARISWPENHRKMGNWRGSFLGSSWLWSTTEGSTVGYDSEMSTKKRIKMKEIVLLFEQEIAVYCCIHLNAQWQLLPTDDLAMKRIKQPNHLPLGKKSNTNWFKQLSNRSEMWDRIWELNQSLITKNVILLMWLFGFWQMFITEIKSSGISMIPCNFCS